VKIQVNGEERVVPPGTTVAQLLASLKLNEQLVAVEVNRRILRRQEYGEVALAAGDEVEIVHFVGGGGGGEG
jgi:thiamine biosynthesis protein ThiS